MPVGFPHAGRVSYTYGLQGPSVLVDTACSSSLVAVGFCHTGLLMGTLKSCLVGGVVLLLSKETMAMYSSAGDVGTH